MKYLFCSFKNLVGIVDPVWVALESEVHERHLQSDNVLRRHVWTILQPTRLSTLYTSQQWNTTVVVMTNLWSDVPPGVSLYIAAVTGNSNSTTAPQTLTTFYATCQYQSESMYESVIVKHVEQKPE